MNQNKSYIPIDLYILRTDTLKTFDIYLKMEPDRERYVLFSQKGSYFTLEVQQTLLSNNITTIYVPAQDSRLYHEYVESNITDIVRDSRIAPEKKSEIVYESSKYIMHRLFQDPRTEIFERTKTTIRGVVDLILSDEAAASHLIRITEYDYDTYLHSVNVGILSIAFAKELLAGTQLQDFYHLGQGFFLHDIGKTALPVSVLNKRGPLNNEEWEVIKQHPEKGLIILEDVGFNNKPSSIIVLQHHERDNGKGYPRGLRGDQIHLFSKICAVADTFDAMTAKRAYQKKHSVYETLEYIKHNMLSREFDRTFFEKFVYLFAPENRGTRQWQH